MQLIVGQELAYPCEVNWPQTNLEKRWFRVCEISKGLAETWVLETTGILYGSWYRNEAKLWNNKVAIVIMVDPHGPVPYLALYHHDDKYWLIGRYFPKIS